MNTGVQPIQEVPRRDQISEREDEEYFETHPALTNFEIEEMKSKFNWMNVDLMTHQWAGFWSKSFQKHLFGGCTE